MEVIQHPKRVSAIPLLSPSPKIFAVKSYIYSDLTREFTDNSFNKEILKKNLQAKRLQKLRNNYEIATLKVQQASSMHQKLLNHLSSVQSYKSQLFFSNLKLESMNKSAIIIQKVVRGYLLRKNVEEKLLTIFKKNLGNDLKTMEKNDKFCLFFVGKKSKDSIILLQRFFRRCLFMKKIRVLKIAYERNEEACEIARSKKFRLYFLMFDCKIKVKSAVEIKTLHIKLKKIRENLAIFRIKSLLNRIKLKLKNIRYRVKRYSKRFNMLPNMNIIPNLCPSPIGSIDKVQVLDHKSPSIQAEDFVPIIDLNKEKTLDIDRYSHSTEYYIIQDAQKKEKIEKGRIVYGIKNKSPHNIFPLFSEHQHENRPQSTKALTIRMNLANPVRAAPKSPIRSPNPKKGLSITLKKQPKRYFLDEIPPYMRETVNSRVKFEETPSPEPNPKLYRHSAENKILYPTYSSRQKVRYQKPEKPKNSTNHKITRPNTGVYNNRKVIRSKQISCTSFIEYNFDPPGFEISEMFQQNFKPIYTNLKSRPESMRPQRRRLSF